MIESTRRGFLASAGAGAAVAGIAAIAPAASAATVAATGADANAATPAAVTSQQTTAHASGELVAHVADVHGDTVTILAGEREVVIRDRRLVARLARAAS